MFRVSRAKAVGFVMEVVGERERWCTEVTGDKDYWRRSERSID